MLKRELRGSLYNNNIIWDHLSRICTWHWNPRFDLVPVHTVSLLEVTSEVQVGKVRDGSLRREQMKFDSARSIWLIKLERVEERKGLSIRTWSSQRSTLPLDSSYPLIIVLSRDDRIILGRFFENSEKEEEEERENSFSPVLSFTWISPIISR